MRDSQVTMRFNTKSWSNDLDDLGVPILGNLQMGIGHGSIFSFTI